MAKKNKVTGGMNKDWASQIRRSQKVTERVREAAEDVLEDAEDVMHSLYGDDGFHYHYKLHSLRDTGWGTTELIVPTSRVARDKENKTVLMSAAGRKLKRKKGGS